MSRVRRRLLFSRGDDAGSRVALVADDKECTEDLCEIDRCRNVPLPSGRPCSGGLCDGAGHCIAECDTDATCATRNDCVNDVCLAGVCQHDPVPVGRSCTAGLCDATGHCLGCLSADDCNDQNDCTTDGCTSPAPSALAVTPVKYCTHEALPVGAACSGGLCNDQGICVECLQNADCDDANKCTNNVCDEGACAFPPVPGQPCDGGVCNEAGTCGPPPFRCDDTKYLLTGDPSTLSVLDPRSGKPMSVGQYTGLLNGIGVRPQDGYIYAVTQRASGTQSLIRLRIHTRVRAGLSAGQPRVVNRLGLLRPDRHTVLVRQPVGQSQKHRSRSAVLRELEHGRARPRRDRPDRHRLGRRLVLAAAVAAALSGRSLSSCGRSRTRHPSSFPPAV